MPLSEEDKTSIRFHLGYPATSSVTTLAQGLPISLDGLFILEHNMDSLRESGIARVRKILDTMDGILFGAKAESVDRMAVKRLGSIETQPNEPQMISRELFDWACVLADQLRAPLYAGSQRYRPFIGAGAAGMAGSIPVRH